MAESTNGKSTYEQWMEGEGIPIVDGYGIDIPGLT